MLGLDLENIDLIQMLLLASVRVVKLRVYGRWMGPHLCTVHLFYFIFMDQVNLYPCALKAQFKGTKK